MTNGPLDLSGADTSGFDAIPAGTYPATVFSVEMKETKGGEGAKLPAGTPLMNVQFRITEPEEYENRRVFKAYVIAPAKIGNTKYAHKARMDGILARFFMAIGYTEEEVTSGDFNPDFEDMVDRECSVRVKVRQYEGEDTNEVTGVKPAGEGVSIAQPGLL